MRTSAVQLPTFQELQSIFASEITRPIPKEKEGIHFTDFSTILSLLDAYDISSSFFTKVNNLEQVAQPDVYADMCAMFDTLTTRISESCEAPDTHPLLNNLYDYLSEADEQKSADLLFVFGSKSTTRTDTALRLFREGLAPKILISGRGPHYEDTYGHVAEAEMLGRYAIEQGIPKDAILIESESITVPDNVKRSLTLLEETGVAHKRILLVNSPFAQRRGWAHFSKMSDVGTTLMRVNTDTVSEQFSRNGWYRNEVGIRTILKEFYGLRISTLVNTA